MKRTPLFLIFGLLLTITSLQAAGVDGDKFQIELFGSFATLNPSDLNKRAEFDHMYESFFTEDQYRYFHTSFGDDYTYTGRMDGEYKKIKNAFPMGFRVKYYLSSNISISLGFKTLSRTQHSQVSHEFDVRSVNPDRVYFYDEFSYNIENQPYSLFVEGHIPMVGLHYQMGEIHPFRFEGYIAAGPLLAQCSIHRERNAITTNSYGYWSENNLIYQIEGKGIGIAVDIGMQLNLDLFKKIGLFIEGGYSYQRAGDITGNGSSDTTRKDQNSAGYTQKSEWEGQWTNVQGSYNRDWGNINFTFPSNEYGVDNFSGFHLDLSGFQIKVGISLKL